MVWAQTKHHVSYIFIPELYQEELWLRTSLSPKNGRVKGGERKDADLNQSLKHSPKNEENHNAKWTLMHSKQTECNSN